MIVIDGNCDAAEFGLLKKIPDVVYRVGEPSLATEAFEVVPSRIQCPDSAISHWTYTVTPPLSILSANYDEQNFEIFVDYPGDWKTHDVTVNIISNSGPPISFDFVVTIEPCQLESMDYGAPEYTYTIG